MASPVHGRNAIIEMWVTDTWYPILCGTDMNLHVEQETILKTGPNSGTWRERIARISQWSASVTGLTKIDNSAESLTWFWAVQESVRLVTQYLRFTFEDEQGGGKQITGYALITSNDITGPAADFSNATITFEGTGELVIAVIEPPALVTVNYYSDYWATTNGLNYISGASSGTSPAAVAFGGAFTLGATDVILVVTLEGIQYDVILTGTPVGRECKFTSGNGRITFPSDIIFDGSQRVWVEFKRTT